LIRPEIRKSNRLTSNAQPVQVKLVHELLQESTKCAEEQMAQLGFKGGKLDTRANVVNMILSTVKKGVTYL
jgi:hypothetical protein